MLGRRILTDPGRATERRPPRSISVNRRVSVSPGNRFLMTGPRVLVSSWVKTFVEDWMLRPWTLKSVKLCGFAYCTITTAPWPGDGETPPPVVQPMPLMSITVAPIAYRASFIAV